MNKRIFVHLACLSLPALCGEPAAAQDYLPPDCITVKPVFITPTDESPPGPTELALMEDHLEWTQHHYRGLLATTFRIDRAPLLIDGGFPLDTYHNAPENAAPLMLSEVLDADGKSRFNADHLYIIVLMNRLPPRPLDPTPRVPAFAGGRPINGGFNTGGGIVIFSSRDLEDANFQSTLRHEIGHGLGLPHVDVYGYDINTGDSMMSYNTAHWTNFLMESPTPGRFIPEDLRGLALNDRGLGSLEFDPLTDVPPGYALYPFLPYLGPMIIPGNPLYVIGAASSAGADFGSSPANAVTSEIRPDVLATGFNSSTMFHSGETDTGYVDLTLTFPFTVSLSGMSIHTRHSGQFHPATRVEILVQQGGGSFTAIHEDPFATPSIDRYIPLAATTAQVWRVRLYTVTGYVVVRGLQFYADAPGGQREIFPPFIPYSGPGGLNVEPLCPAPSRRFPNFDTKWGIDIFDLLAYLNLWFADDPGAEFDGVRGEITIFDLLAFLDCWFIAAATGDGCLP